MQTFRKEPESIKYSNCCGASIIPETDLCSACKEHCEILVEKFVNKDLSWLDEGHEFKRVTCNGKEIR